MVEIRYGDQYEVAEMAGLTVSEAREQFKANLGIPEKARAKLNGSKIKCSLEPDTVLNDDDKLSFAVTRTKMPFLVGALLLALTITGSVFAYGFVNDTTTFNVTSNDSDFADVQANTDNIPSWDVYGRYRGAIEGPCPLFDVDTLTSTYTGDLVVTVSIANADELSAVYRMMSLKLQMVDSTDNSVIDINEDDIEDEDTDYVLLTLNNGSTDMFPGGEAANFTVRLKSGFYISHIYKGNKWLSSYEDPVLFCEVAQR